MNPSHQMQDRVLLPKKKNRPKKNPSPMAQLNLVNPAQVQNSKTRPSPTAPSPVLYDSTSNDSKMQKILEKLNCNDVTRNQDKDEDFVDSSITNNKRRKESLTFEIVKSGSKSVPSARNAGLPPVKPGSVGDAKPISNNQLKKQKIREWRRKHSGKNGIHSTSTDVGKSTASSSLVKEKSSKEPTRVVAIDCEMVGVGFKGSKDMLARVSIVNCFGHTLYDKFVEPMEKVTDYRTFVSGVTPELLKTGLPFFEVQKEVCALLKGRIVVGHAIKNDMKVLYLDHPKRDIRDTSKYFKSSAYGGHGTPSLRKLTEHHIGVAIQGKEHDSVEDARATMRLYTKFKKPWEADVAAKMLRKYGSAKDWEVPNDDSPDLCKND